MGRGKVLEAAEDVGDGVGGHAGKVLPVSPELVAEPANNEELSYNKCWYRLRELVPMARDGQDARSRNL